MSKDIQKPILYKADPWIFVQIELQKNRFGGKLNRNKFINEAVQLYIELVKLTQTPEYGYINEISFNDSHLQRILFERLKTISVRYRRGAEPHQDQDKEP